MEPSSLSRSPSATFAPGSHRRSHPNLHHLSLAPLTPKYPIDPSDYDAYFDPSTSELHTSTSITHISGLPSPGGILTNSPSLSRSNSKSKLKRKAKSKVSVQNPSSTPSGALTSAGFGMKRTTATLQTDASWLVQTGLALTEESRESKGQTWIGKRNSSTSLHTAEERPRSGRVTPNRSRPNSRHRSKRDLTMTSKNTAATEYPAPDWADTLTQAEVAAQVESELADELDDDPYGLLNFEAQYDSEDENEVRKEISRYRFGKWIDGVVDVFLQLDDEYPDQSSQDLEAGKEVSDTVDVREESKPEIPDGPIEPPPQRPRGLWDDAAWFGRLVARTIRS